MEALQVMAQLRLCLRLDLASDGPSHGYLAWAPWRTRHGMARWRTEALQEGITGDGGAAGDGGGDAAE